MIAKRMFLRIFGLNSTLLVLFATLLHIGLHAQTNVSSNPYGTSADFLVNETPAQFQLRMIWWTDSRFGLFIHWNMSSILGTEISWSRKTTRPLDVDKTPAGYVEDPVYDNLYKQFNPIRFDATMFS